MWTLVSLHILPCRATGPPLASVRAEPRSSLKGWQTVLTPWALHCVLKWDNFVRKRKILHSFTSSLFHFPSLVPLSSSHSPNSDPKVLFSIFTPPPPIHPIIFFLFFFSSSTLNPTSRGKLEAPPPPPPPPCPPHLFARRVSWARGRCWLSWWRCHQSQSGGRGSGRDQSKCQGSERGGSLAGPGGNGGAVPAASRSAMLSLSASWGKAAASSHPGGVLVREPAPPYQERWPESGKDKTTSGFGPEIKSGGPRELWWCFILAGNVSW